MGTSTSCPRCGYRLDQADAAARAGAHPSATVEALLTEVEELRATVARLRGSGSTSVIWSAPECQSVRER